jgi:hypothetical protein
MLASKAEAYKKFNEVYEVVDEYLMITKHIWPDWDEISSHRGLAHDAPEGMKSHMVASNIVNMIIRQHDVIEWLMGEVERLNTELSKIKET